MSRDWGKLEHAHLHAKVSDNICRGLYKDYGEAVKDASSKGIPADKYKDAVTNLGALKMEYKIFVQAVDQLQDELDRMRNIMEVEEPDAPIPTIHDYQDEVNSYKKDGLPTYKRAEEYWTKKYPIKKK